MITTVTNAAASPAFAVRAAVCDKGQMDTIEYLDRILAAVEGTDFEPLMTLYLTDETRPAEIRRAKDEDLLAAVKLYPVGATTNSEAGVTDLEKTMPTLEAMSDRGLPLLVHGEVTDPGVDIFDREAVFIDRVLDPIRRKTPGLRVVMEHITTQDGVDYAASGGPDLG